ncbi:MAG TPA: class I SAM-dependent methyltransferase [Solirubrobacteraceae bacterium]|nr:class I SAM-dependent methyltransferase [Solirubrobacteraceae bacterium]
MSAAAVPTGNTYDKYGSRNPVVRRLMGAFERDLDALLERAAPSSVLDVGCGEGVLTERWALRLRASTPAGRVVGVDLDDPKLAAHWGRRRAENLAFMAMDVERLRFADSEFDLVAATEVLEHVADPQRALSEMARVARRFLLVSVPREPLWRALNVARGAYVRQLGNTPGHLNHWTRRSFIRLLARHGEVVEARSPLPWTMLLVSVGR